MLGYLFQNLWNTPGLCTQTIRQPFKRCRANLLTTPNPSNSTTKSFELYCKYIAFVTILYHLNVVFIWVPFLRDVPQKPIWLVQLYLWFLLDSMWFSKTSMEKKIVTYLYAFKKIFVVFWIHDLHNNVVFWHIC